MISVLNKGEVPDSLAYPTIGQTSKTTHTRREELIANGVYTDTKVYNDRYKQKDTKKALKKCHHRKCAYCEQVVEATHVEHYRPKSLYWWLAYSWDNLLSVCPTCNTHKGNNFEIIGTKAVYNSNDLPQIHALRDIYNRLEMPLLLNPECDDLSNMWIFERTGEMNSENERGQYTIQILTLNRSDLCDSRKELIDDFEELAELLYSSYKNDPTKLVEKLDDLVTWFVQISVSPKKPFFAFMNYATHTFINDILQKFYPEI